MASVDPLKGLTLKDLMSDDGVTFEFGKEFEIDEDDRFKFNPQVDFSNDELITYANLHLDLSDDEDDEGNRATDIPLSMSANFEKIKAKSVDVTSDGKVKKLIRQKGVGEAMPQDAFVTIKYSGYFEGQDEPYDSTHMRGTPDKYRLNQGGLIEGLDLAIQSMLKHEVAIFWIHSDYAYGEFGCPPLVPPKGDVMFVIHLVDFIDNASALTFENLDPADRRIFQNVIPRVNYLMKLGANNFNNGKIHPAIRDYKSAINSLDDAKLADDKEELEMNRLKSRAYQNLAICFNKDNQPRRACIACNQVPFKNAKTYYHYGKALNRMGEYTQALNELDKAFKLSPNNPTIVKEMQFAQELNSKYLTMEKRLWSNCLGLNQTDNDEKLKEYEKFAVEMCQSFIDNKQILRQPLPEGLTPALVNIIRKQAMIMGIIVTIHEKYGKDMIYLEKRDYK